MWPRFWKQALHRLNQVKVRSLEQTAFNEVWLVLWPELGSTPSREPHTKVLILDAHVWLPWRRGLEVGGGGRE